MAGAVRQRRGKAPGLGGGERRGGRTDRAGRCVVLGSLAVAVCSLVWALSHAQPMPLPLGETKTEGGVAGHLGSMMDGVVSATVR